MLNNDKSTLGRMAYRVAVPVLSLKKKPEFNENLGAELDRTLDRDAFLFFRLSQL